MTATDLTATITAATAHAVLGTPQRSPKQTRRRWGQPLLTIASIVALFFGSADTAEAATGKGQVECHALTSTRAVCILGRTQSAHSNTARDATESAVAGPVVLPGKETYIAGWTEYNPRTCQTVYTGTWTTETAPKNGKLTTKTEVASGDVCPSLTFATLYYTWTSTDEKQLTDHFVAIWNTPDYLGDRGQTADVSPTVAQVKIDSANLETGSLTGSLVGPDTASGSLALSFKNGDTEMPVTPNDKKYTPGSLNYTIVRPSIKRGRYTQAILKWTVDGTIITGKLSGDWNVLGRVRYSQYNVPAESSCSGGAVSVFIVDSVNNCTFTEATLKSDFISQTQINGTGTSVSYGYVKAGAATGIRKYCKGKFPKGASLDNSFVQVSSVTGSCNRALVPNSSVATADGDCTAVETLVNSENNNDGSRRSQDTCPACSGDFRGQEGHIDNFSDTTSCSAHGGADLGNFWTLQKP